MLFEDEIIQIGYKLETRANLARLGMFYGNKTKASFSNFQSSVSYPGTLASQLIGQVCLFVIFDTKDKFVGVVFHVLTLVNFFFN